MLDTTRTRRVAAATLVGGLLTALQLAAPSSASAAYPGQIATTTTVSITKGAVVRGGSDTANVDVSSGTLTPTGTVTVTVVGVQSNTLALTNGEASQSLPTSLDPGTYRVNVRYDGQGATVPPGGRTAAVKAATLGFQPSSAHAYYTVKSSGGVKGEEGNQGNNFSGSGNVLGNGSSGSGGSGLLGGTGLDTSTELLGLLGLGLVGAGAASIAVNRRRTRKLV